MGLIGGEPTLHSRFDELLELLISEDRAKDVILYTNGILTGRYVDKLRDPKFHLLVNCNDIKDRPLLWTNFEKSLDVLFACLGDRVNLGVNYYKIDFNTDFILALVKKYHCPKIRVSISLPNTKDYRYQPLNYFSAIKPELLAFFQKLMTLGTIPYLDCNILPPCLVTSSEMMFFSEWKDDNPFMSVKTHQTGCRPVIDIMPDGTAVRCFGLSAYTQTNIKDFACISDLRNYYLRTIDAYAVNSVYDERCKICYKYKTMKCSGGCLIYKIDEIIRKRERNSLI